MVFPALAADVSIVAVTEHAKPCGKATSNGLAGNGGLNGARPGLVGTKAGSLRTDGTLLGRWMGMAHDWQVCYAFPAKHICHKLM